MSSGKSSKSSEALHGCGASSEADQTGTTKYSSAEIKALLTANKWWPFNRVDAKILQQMHRASVRARSTTNSSPTHETPLEEAPF